MRKRALSIVALYCALALVSLAAGIDGKWTAKMPAGGRKGGGARSTVDIIFDFKTDGGKLTGSVSGAGRRGIPMAIENGKIEGDKFSFTTVHRTGRGDRKINWEGTVSGSEIKGTRAPEGRGRTVPFTATRQ